MRKVRTISLLAILTASLPGCAQVARQGQTAGLAARCGHPPAWTAPQKAEVAASLDKARADPGIRLLAVEWDRETSAIRICRNGK